MKQTFTAKDKFKLEKTLRKKYEWKPFRIIRWFLGEK